MKAICAHELGGPDRLTLDEVPTPVPLAGEVLIRVRAAALNFPDILMLAGKYQVQPPLPYTPGFELCGVVEQVGEGVDQALVGRRVMAQTTLGAMAEYAVAPAEAVYPAPDAWSDEEAAAFPLVYQTSYFGLAYRGQLRPGETVLVHSAAGGVGLAAVQLAKALGAGLVIGTAGADEKLDVIRRQGADLAVNYRTQDFVAEVKAATQGRGADVIYDPVGGEIGERSTKCIAFEGRLVVIGFTSGEFPNFKANHILVKNYSVVGLHWGHYRQMLPQRIVDGWRELAALIEPGNLRAVVGRRFAMTEAGAAMEYLASRQAIGKVVLAW